MHPGRQLPGLGVETQAAQLAADLAARTGDLYMLLQSSQLQVCCPSSLKKVMMHAAITMGCPEPGSGRLCQPCELLCCTMRSR